MNTNPTPAANCLYVTDRNRALTQAVAEPGQTLMQVLQAMGLVDGICGGGMACGTCAIRVASPWCDQLEPQSEGEMMLLEGLGLDGEGCRLGCQIEFTPALQGMVVEVMQGHD